MKSTIQKLRDNLGSIYPQGEVEAMIRIIFEELMGYSTVDLILRRESDLPPFIYEKIDDIISRLKQKEPLQYILGCTQFHGHKFRVTPATLIPRPETQQLVDLIVEQNQESDLSVLDIGTGSGCIAISLARALRFASVSAIDVSAQALAVAKENATALKARVKFIEADALNLSAPKLPLLNIIVSNPPYICDKEKAAIDDNVLRYEPHTALFVPDDNPLLFYNAIANYAIAALLPGGKLYFEINPIYAKELASAVKSLGFNDIELIRDLYGKERFLSAIKPLD